APPAHEALDGVNSPPGVGDRLALGRVAHQPVALVRERHHARRQPVAFLVGNNLDLIPLHDRHHRVGGAEVDPDDFFFCHYLSSPFSRPSVTVRGFPPYRPSAPVAYRENPTSSELFRA